MHGLSKELGLEAIICLKPVAKMPEAECMPIRAHLKRLW